MTPLPMSGQVSIPSRFNGPLDSGNGRLLLGGLRGAGRGPGGGQPAAPDPARRAARRRRRGRRSAGHARRRTDRGSAAVLAACARPAGAGRAAPGACRLAALPGRRPRHLQPLLRLRPGARGLSRRLRRRRRRAAGRRLALDAAGLDRRRGRDGAAGDRLGGARLPHRLRRLPRVRRPADRLPGADERGTPAPGPDSNASTSPSPGRPGATAANTAPARPYSPPPASFSRWPRR